ncbi:MAG: chorismate mutase [Treponema sp.]|nr:chorismate mutase [Treponema sp.]MCL2237737.1 chorismate mutase [Treponema sp.]
MKKLFALRGAVQCENELEDICAQVSLMYDEILGNNRLDEEDIVSIMFSVTNEINAINPCTALRKSGRATGNLALFSAQEPETKNSLERTIRVIIHCYLEEGAKAVHVYRNGAEVLRPDRAKG